MTLAHFLEMHKVDCRTPGNWSGKRVSAMIGSSYDIEVEKLIFAKPPKEQVIIDALKEMFTNMAALAIQALTDLKKVDPQ